MTVMRQFVLAAATAAALLLCGCIAIPAGEEVVSTEEVSRETITDTKPLASRLEASVEDAYRRPILRVKATGDWREISFERVMEERVLRQKKVVLGLYPGVGSNWLVGAPYSESYVSDALFATIIISIGNVIFWGTPTVVPWFTEFGAQWQPDILAVDAEWAGGFSLFGWAKTGKVVSKETTFDEQAKEREFSQGIAGLRIAVSERITGFSLSGTTDATGTAAFDVAAFPFICTKSKTFDISAAGADVPIATITQVLPSSSLGSVLAWEMWKNSQSYPHEKIYTDDGTIDWSKGRPGAQPYCMVEVEPLGQGPVARQHKAVEVRVRNSGRGAVYRLMARSRCNYSPFDGKFLIVGKIDPGESVTRKLILDIPQDMPSGTYRLEFEFQELNGNQPRPTQVALELKALPRPVLAYTYSIIDDPKQSEKAVGNADGVIQKGEAFDLVVAVKNTGEKVARGVVLSVMPVSDRSVKTWGSESAALGDLAPGAVAEKRFNIGLTAWSSLDSLPVTIELSEVSFDLSKSETIQLPFDSAVPRQPMVVDKLYYVAVDQAVLRSGASRSASEFGRAPRGAALYASGEMEEWIQIELPVEEEGQRHTERLWVERRELTDEQPGSVAGSRTVVVTRFDPPPPTIVFVQPGPTVRETRAEHLNLQVSVAEPVGMLKQVRLYTGTGKSALTEVTRDVRIEKAAEAGAGDSRVISYRADLRVGPNIFRVVATNDRGKYAAREVTINRLPGNQELGDGVPS